jgi:hypothetical protein
VATALAIHPFMLSRCLFRSKGDTFAFIDTERLHRALQTLGWVVSRRRVAQLMRRAGLRRRILAWSLTRPRTSLDP